MKGDLTYTLKSGFEQSVKHRDENIKTLSLTYPVVDVAFKFELSITMLRRKSPLIDPLVSSGGVGSNPTSVAMYGFEVPRLIAIN